MSAAPPSDPAAGSRRPPAMSLGVVRLAWAYLLARPMGTVLNLLLMTLGVAAMSFVLLVSHQVERSFQRDVAGIDLVVGAKGSPLQLILAGVFHIDVPPGNIALADYQRLAAHPQVAKAIPLSLGDTYRGFRIVGTTADYPRHYGATLVQGQWWTAPMQAVAGAAVAQQAGLAPGARFAGSHGLAGTGEAHDAAPYTVSGVMQRCDCVLDRLILTATESVWQVHEKTMALDEQDAQALREEREITLALVSYRSPLAAVSLPRHINADTPMQAAAPAVEVTRLFGLLGVGADTLRGFAAVLLLVAALSVFMALNQSVRERQADLAMLRMLGAPRARLAGVVLAQAFTLAAVAGLLGLAVGQGLTGLLGWMLRAERSVHLTGWLLVPEQAWLVPGLVVLALLAAAWPAWRAMRLDVADLLIRD